MNTLTAEEARKTHLEDNTKEHAAEKDGEPNGAPNVVSRSFPPHHIRLSL